MDKDIIKSQYSLFTCFQEHGVDVKSNRARCVFHNGKNDNLVIHDGGTKATCHSKGCVRSADVFEVYAKLNNISNNEAFKELCNRFDTGSHSVNQKDRWEKECDYVHQDYDHNKEQWFPVIQSTRFKNLNPHAKKKKDFRQSCPDGSKPSNVKSIPFYNYENWCNKSHIACVEGHKDVHTLKDLGIPATCNLAGAGNFKKHKWEQLKDKSIIIFYDNDVPGIKHAIAWHDNLKDIAKSIRIVKLPTNTTTEEQIKEDHKDISDYVEELKSNNCTNEEITNVIMKHVKESSIDCDKLRKLVKAPSASGNDPVDIFAEKELLPVQEFTGNLVPEVIANYTLDEAERMSAPPDFIAVSVVAQLSLITAKKLCMKVKQKDNWIESPHVWGAMIGEPSTKKSPALNTSISFTKSLEKKEIERYREEFEAYEEELSDFMYRKKVTEKLIGQEWEASAKSKSSEDRSAHAGIAKNLTRELKEEEPVPPIENCYIVTDSTYQATTVLQANGSSPLQVVDEITGLFESLDEVKNAQSRAHLLSAYNGKDSFKSITIGRGQTDVDRNMIGLLGGIQPDKYRRFISKAKGNNDGFLARLQLAVYPDPVKDVYIDREPQKQYKNALQNVFDRMDTLDTSDYEECNGFKCLSFSSEAQAHFEKWYNSRPRSLGGLIDSYIQKFPALVARLSLVFHVCESQDKRVSLSALQKAIAFTQYLLSHAKRIYGMRIDELEQTVRRIAKAIQDEQLPKEGTDHITAHQIKRNSWGGINPDLINEALEQLEEANWIQCVFKGKNNRYHVNPKVKQLPNC